MEKFVVIMAGGVGSRFWPRSRKKSPKQLLNIFGDNTMIQETYERIKTFVKPENVFVITNKIQKDLIEDQLTEIPADNIIAEPVGKNTAPCIGLAAKVINAKNKDSVFITLPADHLIENRDKFIEYLKFGTLLAYKTKSLLTFGIQPTRPETGYGYINIDKKNFDSTGRTEGTHKVKRFVEKPNLQKAEEYIESGEYLWNSGMFIWRSDVILEEIQKYLPNVYGLLDKVNTPVDSKDFYETLSEVYPRFESISIDYGIMEKSDKVFCIKGDFNWSDVGSWETVYELAEKDKDKNAPLGDIYLQDTKDSYIYSPEKFTAVLGAENFIVINTDDALLVCRRDKAQDVKKIVDYLNSKERDNLI